LALGLSSPGGPGSCPFLSTVITVGEPEYEKWPAPEDAGHSIFLSRSNFCLPDCAMPANYWYAGVCDRTPDRACRMVAALAQSENLLPEPELPLIRLDSRYNREGQLRRSAGPPAFPLRPHTVDEDVPAMKRAVDLTGSLIALVIILGNSEGPHCYVVRVVQQ
jgi:hypothetical protein